MTEVKLSDWQKWYRKNKDAYLAVKRIEVREKYHVNKTNYKYRLRTLLNASRRNAKNKQVPFDIDLDYVNSLWDSQNGCCLLTKRQFDLNPQNEFVANPLAPSLDRIIPKLGYVKGNVRLIVWGLNVAINEFGLEHFLELAQDVLLNKESNES